MDPHLADILEQISAAYNVADDGWCLAEDMLARMTRIVADHFTLFVLFDARNHRR
jgi:hypothetical protein